MPKPKVGTGHELLELILELSADFELLSARSAAVARETERLQVRLQLVAAAAGQDAPSTAGLLDSRPPRVPLAGDPTEALSEDGTASLLLHSAWGAQAVPEAAVEGWRERGTVAIEVGTDSAEEAETPEAKPDDLPVLSGRTAVDAAEQAEREARLAEDFKCLAGQELVGLSCAQLHELGCRLSVAQAERLVPSEIARFSKAISAFNKAAGIEGAPEAVTLATFQRLSNGDAKELFSDEHLTQDLRQVRRLLLECLAAKQASRVQVALTRKGRMSRFERLLHKAEPLIGVVILINAVAIGLRSDHFPTWDGWFFIESAFTWFFVSEQLLKILVWGPRRHFIGEDWTWNWFDCLLVLVALMDFFLKMPGESGGARSVTVFRMLQFFRLARLAKVLRFKIFHDLSLLIAGVLGGLRTMSWALLCLCYFAYIIAVLLTQMVGQSATPLCGDPKESACSPLTANLDKHREELFGSVARSLFTVFRCYMDGCSSPDGVPLGPQLYDSYGVPVVLAYVAVTIFINMALFNIIAAVFVQNTLDTAKEAEERRREAQEAFKVELAKNMQEIMTAFCHGGHQSADKVKLTVRWGVLHALHLFLCPGSHQHAHSSGGTETLAQGTAEISQQIFNLALDREDVQLIMDKLEVPKTNRRALFDVLDADGSGSLEVAELVKGLLKLRSGGEKNDVVALLLAVQALRKSMRTVEDIVMTHEGVFNTILQKLDALQGTPG